MQQYGCMPGMYRVHDGYVSGACWVYIEVRICVCLKLFGRKMYIEGLPFCQYIGMWHDICRVLSV